MRPFLFAYMLFHVTAVDRAKTYHFQEDSSVHEYDIRLDNFLNSLAKENRRILNWTPIVIRWVFSAVVLIAGYVVGVSHRTMIWPNLPTSELPLLNSLSLYVPFLGLVLPSIFWLATQYWLVTISRSSVKSTGRERKAFLAKNLRGWAKMVCISLVFAVVFNLLVK
jgi:hypothetical protein